MNTENNKIIAEFMGFNNFLNPNVYNVIIGGIQNNLHYKVDELKFHSDWNWLMEVVEKIESLTDINSSGCFMVLESIGFNAKFILDDGTRIFNPCKGETKIQAVYNACLEFITWYNEQNK